MTRTDATRVAPGFDAFYAAERARVVALAWSLSGSRWAAEELAQESLLAAYKRWDQIGAYDDPGAWVRKVVANRAVSGFRRRAAEARAMTRVGTRRVEPMPAWEAPDEELWQAVRKLPRQQAQAVALRYLDDRSTVQIAAILDCSEATVRVHLHRARHSLARQLGLQNGDAATEVRS